MAGHPLEKRLGYPFKDPGIMAEALRHSSYVNEQGDTQLTDNERLEFLGDAVINLVAGDLLMNRFPSAPEGDLSRLRSGLVNEASLAEIARSLDLGSYLELGRGEEITDGRKKDSILADTYEAVVAAIYLDGGFPAAYAIVQRHMTPYMELAPSPGPGYDYKTRLQEQIQAAHKVTPAYTLIQESGPDHDKRFTVRLEVPGLTTTGRGRSKKTAEQEAACKALDRLKD